MDVQALLSGLEWLASLPPSSHAISRDCCHVLTCSATMPGPSARTPLQLAALNGSVRTAQLLLDAGAAVPADLLELVASGVSWAAGLLAGWLQEVMCWLLHADAAGCWLLALMAASG